MVCIHDYIQHTANGIIEELESFDGINSKLVKRTTGIDIDARIQTLFDRLEFYRNLYCGIYPKHDKTTHAILDELESFDGLNHSLVKRATGIDIDDRIQKLFSNLEISCDF
jgi:hypothetical protein